MDKIKTFKLSGLIGLVVAVGYTMYTKNKRTKQQEIIDISPEHEEIQEHTTQN